MSDPEKSDDTDAETLLTQEPTLDRERALRQVEQVFNGLSWADLFNLKRRFIATYYFCLERKERETSEQPTSPGDLEPGEAAL